MGVYEYLPQLIVAYNFWSFVAVCVAKGKWQVAIWASILIVLIRIQINPISSQIFEEFSTRKAVLIVFVSLHLGSLIQSNLIQSNLISGIRYVL